ncbi:DUF4186 domain-containing protein [Candidatus Latescibacterota bacterium]
MTHEKSLSSNDNIEQMLKSLEWSKFRSRFKIRDKYYEYVLDKGMDTVRSHAVDFITSRIAPAFPENDGKQTPMKNHPVFIAQHATATCCRGCLLKWHKIPKGRALDDNEIQYIVNIIMKWIEKEIASDK